MGEAIVIGAGITGVSCAEWLRRDGWTVTLIDRVDPGDPAQASYGNAGLLARSAIVPVSVPGLLWHAPAMLADRNSPLFLRWSYLPRLLPWLVPFLRAGRGARFREVVGLLAELTSDTVGQHLALAGGTAAERYVRTGPYAYLYRDRQAFLHDAPYMQLRHEHGFAWSEWQRDALLAHDPALGPDYNFAAVFKDHGWITDPGDYVAALAGHFAANGGRVLKSAVARLRPGQRPVAVMEDGQEIDADKLVLAAGIWSRGLAESTGGRVNMEAERGYHLFLKGANVAPPFPYMITDAKFVTTPMARGLRCAGIVELGGITAGPGRAPTDLLRRRIRQVYPGLEYQTEETWMGFRPTLPDSLPMLGAAPGAPNVIHAFGSQHVGLTIGPRLGRMVADIASGRRVNSAMPGLSPARFGRGRDSQVFSRE